MAENDRSDVALKLTESILDDLDQDRAPLSRVAQKCERVAMLLNNQDMRAQLASGVLTISDAEAELTSAENSADFAAKSNNAFDSPHWYQSAILKHKATLASWRAALYRYAETTFNELRFSVAAAGVFGAIRSRVDQRFATLLPEATERLSSVYANLRSLNPEDWANAVHSCRRLLKHAADTLFPASDDPKHTDEKYINRLVTWIADKSASETYAKIVGSHLDFIGHRIDAVHKASTKGSHADVTQHEAERYVLYTYLLIGDILELVDLSGT